MNGIHISFFKNKREKNSYCIKFIEVCFKISIMFAVKNDFFPIARQISISSRYETSSSSKDVNDRTDASSSSPSSFLVDVYQVRLWKLLHMAEKTDLLAINDTLRVIVNSYYLFLTLINFFCSCSVTHKNYCIQLLPFMTMY